MGVPILFFNITMAVLVAFAVITGIPVWLGRKRHIARLQTLPLERKQNLRNSYQQAMRRTKWGLFAIPVAGAIVLASSFWDGFSPMRWLAFWTVVAELGLFEQRALWRGWLRALSQDAQEGDHPGTAIEKKSRG